LDPHYDYNELSAFDKTAMNNYTEEEKKHQTHLAYLAPIFCSLPDFMIPVLQFLIKLNLTRFYNVSNSLFRTFQLSTSIFPNAHPINPGTILRSIVRGAKFYFLSERSPLPKENKTEQNNPESKFACELPSP
ncbi:MAG: hypothetical protein ACE5EK_03340, partial [Nitrospinales bacterium]